MAPAMFADVTDYVLQVGTTSYCPALSVLAGCNVGGLAAAGASSSLDLNQPSGTGLGTVTLTYNPGPGTYNVDFWLYEALSQPFFNEYGSTGGSPVAGQSWQIDVPDYEYGGELGTAGAGTIIANTQANTLANTNYVPGKTDNYLLNCPYGLSTCNDVTSMAMGFGFTLAAGQEEVVSFTVSTTQPSGFYLEQIHPVDAGGNPEVDYFFTGSATTQPITTVIPEPGSWILLATTLALLLFSLRRRSATT